MTDRTDHLTRELRRLDPVEPGELDGAAASGDAAKLLERIVAGGHEAAPDSRGPRRRRMPRLALGAAAAAAVAVVALLMIHGLPSAGGSDDGLAAALDEAAAVAASQPPAAGGRPYTYLKTREMSVSTNGAERRSWKVRQSATREEWVTRDGAGRLRIVDDPSRFIGAGDRAAWEGAGEPRFLTLGFGRRTEDRWLDAGMLRGGVAELPVDPDALVARLRAKAEVEHGEIPVDAATLQLIAEDLRDPGASPTLRQALFRAIKRVPGVEYLGAESDPVGRRGVAVGVTGSRAGARTLYSLIFDPGTGQVLASEASPLPRGAAGAPGPTPARAWVYLKARGIETLTGSDGAWLSGFEPPTAAVPHPSNLAYRMPGLGAS